MPFAVNVNGSLSRNQCCWAMARPVATCSHRSLFRAAKDASKNVKSRTMPTVSLSKRETMRWRPSTVRRFRLLFVGVGAVEGVSGGGGTAWMLVRPASEDVAGIGVEESFAELMKLRFLKKEETKKRTEENRGNREESPGNSFLFLFPLFPPVRFV